MSKIFVCCGLPGSGKTTWLRDKVGEFENINVWSLNALRMQFARDKTRSGFPDLRLWEEPSAKDYSRAFNFANNRIQHFGKVCNATLSGMLSDVEVGIPLFIDNMNLHYNKRMQLFRRALTYTKNVECIWFDTPFEICVENQIRNRNIPMEQLEHLRDTFDIPEPDELAAAGIELTRVIYDPM